MQKQLNLLNEICSVFFSSPEKFDSLEYEYKFNPEESWIGTKLTAKYQGKIIYMDLSDQEEDALMELCEELHDEMQSHTGGDWRKFILTIDESGEAKTKFIYEIQSCMDEFKSED